jgi:hypothetical protein
MLKAVARLRTRKGDDVGALQQQIQGLKREGQEASEEIDRLKRERASAASYDETRDLDDRIDRQIWVTEHCAAAIPQLELELGAARAAQQAKALARHKKALIEIYPKLKAAILAATDAQKLVMDAHAAASQELGEAVVSLQLPAIQFAGFLVPDLVSLWQQTNDRIIADLARQPKPAAIPAPARAAPHPPPTYRHRGRRASRGVMDFQSTGNRASSSFYAAASNCRTRRSPGSATRSPWRPSWRASWCCAALPSMCRRR